VWDSWSLSGTGKGFSPSFFSFPLLIIIPPLLHAPLLPPHVVYSNPDQTPFYHIRILQVWGFVSDLVLGCLQIEEVKFLFISKISNINKIYIAWIYCESIFFLQFSAWDWYFNLKQYKFKGVTASINSLSNILIKWTQ
jgi:hypothetical protein